jgi:vacuolar-type H+-ATPase subunit I/STV1
MEFTKSDLKTGMFVKNRNGDYKIVIGELLSGLEACTTLGAFSDSLINKYSKSYDIVAAYKAKEPCFLSKYLNGDSLNLVWEQTGQTEAQKEMEELQAQITKLQEQAKVLQSKL